MFENYDDARLYDKMMKDILTIETTQAFTLGNRLYEAFEPKSVIDVGCGPGIYLLPFKEQACEVFGIDACPTGGECLDPSEFERVDLRIPYIPRHKYDLALCLEVAEHLQEHYAEQLIETLCLCSDTIVFTGATPGQGGTYHFNEQPHEYWLEKFAARNYKPFPMQDVFRAWLQGFATPPYCPWLKDNCFILTNR
jgi:SAM-dependent methyltransferase